MKHMNRNEMIAVALGIVVVVIILSIGVFNAVFRSTPSESAPLTGTSMKYANTQGLTVEDITLGNGAEAVPGSVVVAHYTGTLEDGTVFDSSVTRGTPFQFTLGTGQVIRGWDLGIAGMKVGGKRKLTIAPELAYGSRAIGAIPADSTLIFEVELLGVSNSQ